jgi:hypothetical protein
MRILRRFAALALVGSSILASTSAFADESADDRAEKAERRERAAAEQADAPSTWYGYQTLAVDASATAIMGLSLAQKGSALPALGVLTYAVGAPIVHIVHGHGYKAFGDLALRLAAPVATGFVGAIIGGATVSHNDTNPFAALGPLYFGAIIGTLVGVAGAITIDATVIAREDTARGDKDDKGANATPSRAALPPSHVAWTPTFAPATGGATAGVAGTF